MAKYTITHACGHEQEHQLVGKESERRNRIDWLRTTDCRACSEAAEAAKVLRANAGLPALEGSEKQVAWAIKLRAKLIIVIDREEEHLLANANTDEIRGVVREKAARMRGMTTAKYWIDRETGGDMAGRLARNVVAEMVKRQGDAA